MTKRGKSGSVRTTKKKISKGIREKGASGIPSEEKILDFEELSKRRRTNIPSKESHIDWAEKMVREGKIGTDKALKILERSMHLNPKAVTKINQAYEEFRMGVLKKNSPKDFILIEKKKSELERAIESYRIGYSEIEDLQRVGKQIGLKEENWWAFMGITTKQLREKRREFFKQKGKREAERRKRRW